MDSIEDFKERIVSLNSELLAYRNEINDLLNAMFAFNNNESKFDLKNDPLNLVKMLQNDINDIVSKSIQYPSLSSKDIEQIDQCKALIDTLTLTSEILNLMSKFNDFLSQNKYLVCCDYLNKINSLILKFPSPNSETGSGFMCRILRKEKKILKNRLLSKIKRILNESIQFDYGHILINKQLRGYLKFDDQLIEDPISLSEIWQSLISLEKVNESIDEILSNICIFILIPLWREKKAQYPMISSKDDSKAELLFESITRNFNSQEFSNSLSSTSIAMQNTSMVRQKNGSISSSNEIFQSSILGNGLKSPFQLLEICKLPIPPLLDILGQVFSFLWSELLTGSFELAEIFSVKLNSTPVSFSSILIDSISSQIPKLEHDLPAYKKSLEQPCRQFEQKLNTFGFLPSLSNDSDNNQGPLSKFLGNISSIYADLRRRDILKHARELVLSDYHNTMIAAGDALEDELSTAGDIGDPKAIIDQSGSFAIQKLKFDSCQVSLASCRLLKLIHDIMKQACVASIPVSNVLYQSARDCIEIFLAVVPMKFSDLINKIPRMGAIFYNDCLYIAHNCTILTHKYRQELSKLHSNPVFMNSIGFSDFIPRLRKAGDACMKGHIEEQKSNIMEFVERVQINASVEDLERNIPSRADRIIKGGLKIAEKFVNISSEKRSYIENNSEAHFNNDEMALSIIRHFEKLSKQWQGVLQDLVYSRILGHLVDVVLKACMLPLLSAECISESSCLEISRVYKIVLKLRAVFPNEGKKDESMQKICPLWKKFVSLADLLEYNLNDVAEWLPRKKFIAFTGSELNSLIKALFEDSSKRQSILNSILEMSS